MDRTDATGARRRIVIIGAGPGGICTGIKLKEAGIDDFIILEKGSGPGGTWYHNRYPGAECDVRSHLYSFSFELNPNWSRAFAGHAEIRAYFEHCVAKYGLAPSIRYGHEVVSARWDDVAGLWHLTLKDGQTLEAGTVVSAIGMYNEISWPDIPGLHDFKGKTFHSARWQRDHDLKGRTVGVIGSAASAVQFIPEIAKEAGQLVVFQRTANWVIPKQNIPFTEAEKEAFAREPERILAMRKQISDELEGFITTLYGLPDQDVSSTDPAALAALTDMGLENLAVVTDPAVRAKLTPTVPFGSQRPLLSDDFFPTFNRPNVELVTERIARISADGVVTEDGVEHKLDTLVIATGFKANQYLSVLDVKGRDGVDLVDAWNGEARAYRGVTTAGFPNLFMLYGPNTNGGSILFMIECQVAYTVRHIARMRAEGTAWIDVRPEAMQAYNDDLHAALAKVSVFHVKDGSKYYRAASGRVVAQWPYTMAAYDSLMTSEDEDAYQKASFASV